MNRRIRQQIETIDQMIEALTAIRRALPELERRNRFAAGGDGFPGSSSGGFGGSGEVSRPTERAALAKRPVDPVRGWTKDVFARLNDAAGAIAIADSRRQLIFEQYGPVDEPERCENCSGAATRLRDGRCDACYTFRRRNGVERRVSA